MGVVIPLTGIELPNVGQISFVVEDLSAGMRRFDRSLGPDAFDVYRLEPPFLEEPTCEGDPVDHGIAIALADIGETSLELVEPLYGPSIHRDSLEVDGEGFHHVAVFDFETPRATVDSLRDAGYPPVRTGSFAGTHYWYFDLGDVVDGLYYEIVTRDRSKPDPHAVYPDDYA